MEFKISTYSIWEYGSRTDSAGNPHQEDSIYPRHGDPGASDSRLFVLCDGMGGHDAGEIASAAVCEAIASEINSSMRDGDIFSEADLQAAIDAGFNALDIRDNGAERKMGTTLTLLKLHAGGATIAHIGDSRVYHIRPGNTAADTCILHVTSDHSLVNDLVKAGQLSPEQAASHPRRNILTKAMQPHLEYRPRADVYTTADILPGDVFYMCSDGMLEQMNDNEIKRAFSHEDPALRDFADKIGFLIDATKNNSDNHTAMIVHIDEVKNATERMRNKQQTANSRRIHNPASKKPALKKWIAAAVALTVIACAIILFTKRTTDGSDIRDSVIEVTETVPRNTEKTMPTTRRQENARPTRNQQSSQRTAPSGQAPVKKSAEPPVETEEPPVQSVDLNRVANEMRQPVAVAPPQIGTSPNKNKKEKQSK